MAIVRFYLIPGYEDESERSSTLGSSLLGSHDINNILFYELIVGFILGL
jgi:hypothetical protein